MPKLEDVLVFLVKTWPGRTEVELAQAIYGKKKGIQQRVNWHCRMLADAGKVARRGNGGSGDPFRYYPA
jgi:hypothetical protein